jgi:nitric oxide reductase NorD protein
VPETVQRTAGTPKEPKGGSQDDAGDASTGAGAPGLPDDTGGDGGDTVDPEIDPVTGKRLPPGTGYPEWDTYAGAYRPRGGIVRPWEPEDASDGAWADAVLDAHVPLVRLVRQRFERFRARRLRLGRQRDGDELDVAACVDALVAIRAGEQPDDRLYAVTRPARRGLAVLLLVDASGSTQAEVSPGVRVIDVERTAVLLAGEAFDALGDLFAVHAFSGVGAHNVRVSTLKAFGERNGAAVRQRVSAVAPEGNTRLGTAVRHATALLAAQPAGHRLLIILSDGRPNDMGGYEGDYAVEDSRRAMVEARASGVHPFCLTVDRESPEYMGRIFGPTGHTLVTHPDHVPSALLGLVRQLLSG